MALWHRTCSRCVMDTTDPDIVFDEHGLCNHCRAVEAILKRPPFSLSSAEKKAALDELTARIKADGRGRKFDCVLGLSGGVDSTYVAYLSRQFGLRPLAVHLDNGWDTELSVRNMKTAVDRLGLEFVNVVADREEFRGIQLAFLHAGTPDLEIPSDHAINALLHITAGKHGIRHILSGVNTATESIFPKAWSQGHGDWRYIRAVHRQHTGRNTKSFPFLTFTDAYIYGKVRRIRIIPLLNFLDYAKSEALKILQSELNYEKYPYKHYESVYTRFFQGYILPERFGYDKRRAHFSSLIMTGQMGREEALKELEKPPYPDPEMLRSDMALFKGRLGLSDAEFDGIMRLPKKTMLDYPCYDNSWLHAGLRRMVGVCKSLAGRGKSR